MIMLKQVIDILSRGKGIYHRALGLGGAPVVPVRILLLETGFSETLGAVSDAVDQYASSHFSDRP